jgi:hypothetical protein
MSQKQMEMFGLVLAAYALVTQIWGNDILYRFFKWEHKLGWQLVSNCSRDELSLIEDLIFFHKDILGYCCFEIDKDSVYRSVYESLSRKRYMIRFNRATAKNDCVYFRFTQNFAKLQNIEYDMYPTKLRVVTIVDPFIPV